MVAAVDTLTVLGLPVAVVDRVRSVAEQAVVRIARVVDATAPVVERVRGVRRGYLVAGAAGVVALVVAVALGVAGVSGGTEAGETGVTNLGEGASTPSVVEGGVQNTPSPADEVAETSRPVRDSNAPESVADPEPGEWPAIVDELMERWRECRMALTSAEPGVAVDCASTVVHTGSAAAQLIGVSDPRHELLERWREQGGESIVTQRMGGAALVDLLVSTAPVTGDSNPPATTTAASLLVVRSEAGWRVRDVLSVEPLD